MGLNNHLLRKLLIMLVAVFSFTCLQAQEGVVTGSVIDANDGMGIPGASIVVKGTTIGTTTDINGKYSIKADPTATLIYSFVGYRSQEVLVGNQTIININLAIETENLSEVMVIGYGQVKKGDATGAVSAVSSDDFNKGAITSPQSLIMGKSAGVVVTTSNGAPGAGATIRIRGGSSLLASNDPLIVIDGFPMDNGEISGLSNPLSTINPNDIESMTILKDASATAIYGSRASNGVILITTKKGGKGKLKITYNGNVSVGQVTDYFDMFNGDEFRALVKDHVANYGLSNAAESRLGTANTDWQKEIYRTSVSTDHNVSILGNAYNTPFRASVGHTVENGILKNSNINRTTASINVSPSFFDDQLKVTLNAKGMHIKNNFSNTDAIGSAFEFDPSQSIRNNNTTYGGYFAWVKAEAADPLNGEAINIATHNPMARLAFRDNTSVVNRFIGNAKLDYNIPTIAGLSAHMNAGYDYAKSNGDNNTDPKASWGFREPEKGVEDYTQENKTELLNLYFNYKKEFGVHNIDATAGYEWQHYYKEGFNHNRPWLKTDDVYVGEKTSPYKSEYFLVSFFGRLNYSLMDKYLITATLRNDGSSRFQNNKWGLFPSVAAAWKINNESFVADIEQISDLKLRLGYGITGQQDIGNFYPSIPIYRASEQGAYYQFGNDYYSTLRPDPYDANIKWEETTTYNAGLDFGLFNQKITGTFDIYKRITKDLIGKTPIAAGTNFSNFLTTNVGEMENKGYEVSLTYHAITTKDMTLEFGANLSHNENTITALSKVKSMEDEASYDVGGISGGTDNKVMRNSTGYAANTFYLFKQIYGANGMPIEGLYFDRTGKGGDVTGNNDNKYMMETPTPDYMIGMTTKFTYKNFDFSMAGRLSLGNYVYNNNASNRAIYQNLYNQSGYLANVPKDVLKSNFQLAQYWSDFYLEDASFFKMDNITLGYSFDKLITNKISGRISATVQNAFTITKYSGLDPEVDGGIDNNIYPRPRVYMLGVNLNF